jgi:ABC-2 type transport system permease protein
MERLQTIMRKEFYHILRDARTLGMILLLPGVLLVLLGFGVSGESSDIPMAVVDYSRTDQSRAYIEAFTSSGDFKTIYQPLSEDEMINLMDQDLIDVGLLIPEDFGREIATGGEVSVQLYVNGSTDPTIAQTIQLKLSSIASTATQKILIDRVMLYPEAAGMLVLPVNSLLKVLYNPNGESGLFMIPGLIPIILQVQALLLSALSIVREREQGTMEQLIVTPVKRWELMLGKIIPYLLVSLFNVIALLILGDWIFGVRVAGNYLELFGLSAVFIIGSLGMGVLISNISQSQMQAMYLAVFIVLIPAIILSGLMFPRENMPAVTYWFGAMLPVTHYLDITRGIMLRGINSEYLWGSIIPLIALSIFYFVASVLVFKKRI